MSWLVVFLGLVLAGGGGAALYASIDLQTTMLGLVYATCGAVGVSGGVIVVALGLMMRKLDALRRVLPGAIETAIAAARAAPVEPQLAGLEPAGAAESSEALSRVAPAIEPPPMAADDDIASGASFATRAARAPQPPERDPPAPPTLVGRYAAGGANYSLYSDGSIEAETDQGAFKFDSMNEFKAYIAAKRG